MKNKEVKIGNRTFPVAFNNRAKFRLGQFGKDLSEFSEYTQFFIMLHCVLQVKSPPSAEDLAEMVQDDQFEPLMEIILELTGAKEAADEPDPLPAATHSGE